MNDINTKYMKSNIGILFKVIILLNFIIVTNATLQGIRIIYWPSIGLILVLIIWCILTSGFRINYYLIWIFTFSFIVIASSLWALDIEYAIEGIKSIILTYPIFILLSIIIKKETDFYLILKLFLYSQIINAVYILAFIDLATLGDVRLGGDSLGAEWNANKIGMLLAFAAFTALNLIKVEKRKLAKIIYIFSIGLFSFLTIMTGSRKALLILLFTLSVFYILNSGNKKLLNIVIAITASIVFIYIVMNVESLYIVLGSRLDGLLVQITGQGVADKSSTLRFGMIEYGLDKFQNKPIWGYGINNFRALYGGTTGWYTYSHNNYIEILIGVGIVGTLFYYASYIYIIKSSINRKHPLLIFSFISVVSIIMIEIGLVTYDSFYIQFFICLSFSAVHLSKMNQRNKIVYKL